MKFPLTVFLLLQVWAVAFADDRVVNRDLLPPGQIVDIGGHRLHINCLGEGEPTIVFDSGAGGFSLEWALIQNVMSPQTRVCAYDRAGYGWSEMGPLPRTSKRIVNELHTLLSVAMIPGPYILVGHSFGGYTARYFASHYPEEMAALVLIDSSHPEQTERLPQYKTSPAKKYPARSRTRNISRPVLHEHYPEETGARAYRLMSSWKYRFTVQEELLSLPQSAIEVLEAAPLPMIPLVVLTRGQRVWPNNGLGDEMEKIWMQMQDELSLLSRDVVHLIAEQSGHSIHLDQPGLVISALQVLLNNRQGIQNQPRRKSY